MKITNFKLPQTKLSIVVWYRNGIRGEQLVNTPESNVGLTNVMFNQHRVGPSEIRAVKAVNPQSLFGCTF